MFLERALTLPSTQAEWELAVLYAPLVLSDEEMAGVAAIVDRSTGLVRASRPLARGESLHSIVEQAILEPRHGRPCRPSTIQCDDPTACERLKPALFELWISVELVDEVRVAHRTIDATLSKLKDSTVPGVAHAVARWVEALRRSGAAARVSRLHPLAPATAEGASSVAGPSSSLMSPARAGGAARDLVFRRPSAEWPKASAVLLELVESLVGPDLYRLPLKQVRQLLGVAVNVWNAVVMADHRGDGAALARLIDRPEALSAPLIERLVAAKRAGFMGDPRLMELEEVRVKGKRLVVTVATRVTRG